jgi:hypothetical protein
MSRGEFALAVRPLTQAIIMKCKEKRLLGEVTLALQNILKYCIGSLSTSPTRLCYLGLLFSVHCVHGLMNNEWYCRVRAYAGRHLRAYSQ